jgi:hypothetical protein
LASKLASKLVSKLASKLTSICVYFNFKILL